LERSAGRIGERVALRIAIAAKAEHEPPDRVRRVFAILKNFLEAAVARCRLVALERRDEIVKGLDRELMLRCGPLERDEHRMRGGAVVHPVQFLPPPCEQAQTLRGIADLVTQIVGPAAKRVDVIEILMQFLGKQEAYDVKIFVVMRREPACVVERFLGGPRSLEIGRLQIIGGREKHSLTE